MGVEGRRLGIPVSLVKIPGKICWSKLLDYPEHRGQLGCVDLVSLLILSFISRLCVSGKHKLSLLISVLIGN